WLDTLPAGGLRDGALRSASYQFMSEDPPLAARLIAGIGDDKIRNSQYENLANNWMRSDPQGAALWIAQSTLPPDVKTRLLAAKR
ncbi:MAG: hypothetical protein QOD99_1592, partial [Chthoniobacter sp.]|nr:hypothetical protein [Chthoniobacter sp.]